MLRHEPVRYIINGLIATAVNYLVLNFNLLVLGMKSAGIANFIAAIFGITASFLGNRYFVYKEHTNSVESQIVRFLLLYGFLALTSGFVMYIWSDLYGFSYQTGFLIATFIQVLFSYFGNKVLVFKNEN
ncbi:MAG TPA: GtrA family protein [Nitratifractor sp.]|nr:GtrA family protein [Nitratifractor sp.]